MVGACTRSLRHKSLGRVVVAVSVAAAVLHACVFNVLYRSVNPKCESRLSVNAVPFLWYDIELAVEQQ